MSTRWQPGSTLPPLYARWMNKLLDGPIPSETTATCEHCVMCADAPASPASLTFFNPATKCCTYIPALPNFLVGRVLEDDDPAAAAGRASVERRIDERVGVTPLGLAQPPVHATLYGIGGTATFGHARALRCPHYREEAGGACGIWRHRNGVCSTWFCKHDRGAVGQHFWHALDQLLAVLERELARWCLVRLDVEPEVLARLLPRGSDGRGKKTTLDAAAVDGRVDDETFGGLWGRWRGRERELYRAAASAVAELEWRDVLRIAGGSGEALSRIVASAHQARRDEAIPERLIVGPLQVLSAGRDHLSVAAYNGLDPLDVPRMLVDLLPAFDGRPTDEVLRDIRATRRVNVEPALVRRLVDFGVLVPAPQVSAPDGAARSASPGAGGSARRRTR
jgi:hypothetical protein